MPYAVCSMQRTPSRTFRVACRMLDLQGAFSCHHNSYTPHTHTNNPTHTKLTGAKLGGCGMLKFSEKKRKSSTFCVHIPFQIAIAN